MIPILSSIIVGASKNEKWVLQRFLYLFGLCFIYEPCLHNCRSYCRSFWANLQVALQNPYVIVAFALVLWHLFFYVWYFELRLPESLQSKISKTTNGKQNQRNCWNSNYGILSALIVGPCVAPTLGWCFGLYRSNRNATLGGMALFVMSLGMGMPLLLIGLGVVYAKSWWLDGKCIKSIWIVMLGLLFVT